jgi:hypothetical protein
LGPLPVRQGCVQGLSIRGGACQPVQQAQLHKRHKRQHRPCGCLSLLQRLRWVVSGQACESAKMRHPILSTFALSVGWPSRACLGPPHTHSHARPPECLRP